MIVYNEHMINRKEVKDGDIITNKYGIEITVVRIIGDNCIIRDMAGNALALYPKEFEMLCNEAVSVCAGSWTNEFCDARR